MIAFFSNDKKVIPSESSLSSNCSSRAGLALNCGFHTKKIPRPSYENIVEIYLEKFLHLLFDIIARARNLLRNFINFVTQIYNLSLQIVDREPEKKS